MTLVSDYELMATAWLQQAALGQVKAVKRTRYLGRTAEGYLYIFTD